MHPFQSPLPYGDGGSLFISDGSPRMPMLHPFFPHGPPPSMIVNGGGPMPPGGAPSYPSPYPPPPHHPSNHSTPLYHSPYHSMPSTPTAANLFPVPSQQSTPASRASLFAASSALSSVENASDGHPESGSSICLHIDSGRIDYSLNEILEKSGSVDRVIAAAERGGLSVDNRLHNESIASVPSGSSAESFVRRSVGLSNRWIVYALKGGLLRVIDRSTQCKALLRGHSSPVVDLSLNDNRLATVSVSSVQCELILYTLNPPAADSPSTDEVATQIIAKKSLSSSFAGIEWWGDDLLVANNKQVSLLTASSNYQNSIDLMKAESASIKDINIHRCKNGDDVLAVAFDNGSVELYAIHHSSSKLLRKCTPFSTSIDRLFVFGESSDRLSIIVTSADRIRLMSGKDFYLINDLKINCPSRSFNAVALDNGQQFLLMNSKADQLKSSSDDNIIIAIHLQHNAPFPKFDSITAFLTTSVLVTFDALYDDDSIAILAQHLNRVAIYKLKTSDASTASQNDKFIDYKPLPIIATITEEKVAHKPSSPSPTLQTNPPTAQKTPIGKESSASNASVAAPQPIRIMHRHSSPAPSAVSAHPSSVLSSSVASSVSSSLKSSPEPRKEEIDGGNGKSKEKNDNKELKEKQENALLSRLEKLFSKHHQRLNESVQQQITQHNDQTQKSINNSINNSINTLPSIIKTHVDEAFSSHNKTLAPSIARMTMQLITKANETLFSQLNDSNRENRAVNEKIADHLSSVSSSINRFADERQQLEEKNQQQTEEIRRLKNDVNDLKEAMIGLVTSNATLSKALAEIREMTAAQSALIQQLSANKIQSPATIPSAPLPALASELTSLIHHHRHHDAFSMALSAGDLSTVVYLCSQFDSQQFSHHVRQLSPPVLVSLIQQLAFDLKSQSASKLGWMVDALNALDPRDRSVAHHINAVLHEISNNIEQYARNAPPSDELNNARRLIISAIHAINPPTMSYPPMHPIPSMPPMPPSMPPMLTPPPHPSSYPSMMPQPPFRPYSQ